MAVAPTRPAPPSDDERWRIVEMRMRRLGNRPDALIETLHAVQQAFGSVDDEALRYVAASLQLPPSTVFGVATFYHYFRLRPPGAHTCVVCTGTACYINGATAILELVRERLGVQPGATTDDGRLTLLTGRCFGSCSLAPAVIVDGEVGARVEPDALVDRLAAL